MKNILLITLGNSPMIVTEAVLDYGFHFNEVHVFTTDNDKLPGNALILNEEFLNHFPGISFSITALKNVEIPNSTDSHQLFEEGLFQWYVEKAGEQLPYACISGGTKTIPSTTQQAVRYFGANDVFHIITDTPPKENPTNYEEVKEIMKAGKLKFASLGMEPGWETLKNSTPARQFSTSFADKQIVCLFWKDQTPEKTLSKNIHHIMQSVKTAATGKASNWVPFGMLRLLPPEIFHWLQKPLDMDKDAEWVKALPKTDLHCHLGGFATQSPLLNIVIYAAINSADIKTKGIPAQPLGWPLPEKTILLTDYMRLGDANGSAILCDPGCLKKQVELLYAHFLDQNIRYAEVRCSPDNYTSPNRPSWEVLQNIQEYFQQNMELAFSNNPDTACYVNLLVIATRKTEGDLSSISRHLALAITAAQYSTGKKINCRVVGVDLAGYENKDTRPAYFANNFIGVHRSGLAVTAHVGKMMMQKVSGKLFTNYMQGGSGMAWNYTRPRT